MTDVELNLFLAPHDKRQGGGAPEVPPPCLCDSFLHPAVQTHTSSALNWLYCATILSSQRRTAVATATPVGHATASNETVSSR